MKKFLVVFAACVFMAGCKLSVENLKKGLSVRTSFVSDGKGYVAVSVWPENSDGNIVTGAAVTVRDASNQVWYCDFNNDKQVYSTNMESSGGELTVTVKSAVLDQIYKKAFPHKTLSSKPVLKVFSDESGNSVLSGKSVDPSEDIQIAWNSLGDGIVYNVQVRSALSVKWSKSTSVPSITIPAGTLSDGNFYLQIAAQWISGDPLFEKEDYYSQSTVTSSNLSFYTETK